MRNHCEEVRDLAKIDMLTSTGMRVGEMVLLNYARTKLHLQEYLTSRTDDNPALFVALRAPHERIKIGGIEYRLREIGKRLNIPKVHPHKFRRTMATMAIDKGMPIEQVQQLLGHQKIDTIMHYAMVKHQNVKLAQFHAVKLLYLVMDISCAHAPRIKGDYFFFNTGDIPLIFWDEFWIKRTLSVSWDIDLKFPILAL